MVLRPSWLAVLAWILLLPSVTPAVPGIRAAIAASGTPNLLPYVDPFIGTGSGQPGYGIGNEGGHVFPGAAYPHGMVQWSPDTTVDAGGYRYVQSVIDGFSLTHFSGRGCRSYQDIPFMPTIGPVSVSPAVSPRYDSPFSHRNERASPGYYHVALDATNIAVDLTVTPRTGMATVTYPPSPAATMLIDAGGSATGNSDAGTGVQIEGPDWVTGSATGGNFCGRNSYTVYFAAQFSRPFTSFGTWNGATLSPGSRTSNGRHSGAYLTFDTTHQLSIQVKMGLSFVGVANARDNLARENPGWDFETVRQHAAAAWNQALNQIQVGGGTPEQRVVFYTALYHTLFHPNIFSDANGQYIGFDRRIHTAMGYTQYENFPGWDMYRSLIGLRALLEPAATSDMLQSLVADAQQGGGGLPRWQVANDNSGGMVGDSQDVVIATAYALGARHFHTAGALQAMDRGASDPTARSGSHPTREGLHDYLNLGYVSADIRGSASITLEYATDDFAIAQFAAALGNRRLHDLYSRRALNWQHLWDPATGYIEPRTGDGRFVVDAGPTSIDGFVEGDSAQYTWIVPFDLPDLFARMGGNAVAVRRLDNHFAELNAGPVSPYAFMGNEPEENVPWAYDFAGVPYRTQAITRRIVNELFHATPDGLPGNDDGGALSSWYVFAAIGLYPAIPGVSGFALGSPLFPSITVHLGNGRQLRIVAPNAGAATPYIQHLTLNGRPAAGPWLPYAAIARGATLGFTLGSTPQPDWGSSTSEAPPVFYAP